MKRIQSACLEQTSRFEAEEDFNNYIKKLNSKGVKYKLVGSEKLTDNSIIAKLKLQYQNYNTGDYLT